MSKLNLRQKPRISYYEPEEPNLDEYVFCTDCQDFVYEYCSIHGPLLVIPDDKVPAKTNLPSFIPRAALTIPNVFLHLARSIIPGAGIGVFATLTLPRGVRFGPYRGRRTTEITSKYCWQIKRGGKWCVVVDGADGDRSNWMRYVNCARGWPEQNLAAFQYCGEIYYRTIKVIPRFTELLVFYGSQYALELDIDLRSYNSPVGYAQKFGARPVAKTKTAQKHTAPKISEEYLEDVTPTISKKQKNTIALKNTGTDTKQIDNSLITDNNKSKLKKSVNIQNNLRVNTKNVTDIAKVTNVKERKNKVCNSSSLFSKDNNNNFDNETKLENICVTTDTDSKKHQRVVITESCFKCKICEYRTVTRDLQEKHMRFHDKGRPFVCDICGYRFKIKRILIDHIKFHTCEKSFQCTFSNKIYKDKITLNDHLRVHTGELYICDICNKSFNQITHLNIHKRVHTDEKPHRCDICNKSFSFIYSLNVHKRVHTGEKPYTCDICNKSFNQICDLNRHKRVHTGEKPYTCDICNKSFNLFGNLNTHKRVHTGEKPYKCDICNKSFNIISNLNRHKRVHTGEKPYTCDICNKSFNLFGNLNTHKRVHTGEKPYKCDICNKSFNIIGNLNRHKRVHTGEKPYTCDICNKSFNQICDLNTHKRVHTGEKPYTCDICNKSFTHSSYFKLHINLHTGNKPYKCDFCSRYFSLKQTLKNHLRTHKTRL